MRLNALLTVPGLLSTDITVDDLRDIGRHSDEGCSSVDSGTSVLEFEGLVSELDRVEFNLPVSLAADRDVVNVTLEVVAVDSTENGLTHFRVGSEPEREDGVVEESLVDHVVEGRNDVLNRDRVVSETKDTICEQWHKISVLLKSTLISKCRLTEFAESESESGFDGRFSEILLLDGQITNRHDIVRDDSLEGSRTVLNLELGSVRLVSRRSFGVVLGL